MIKFVISLPPVAKYTVKQRIVLVTIGSGELQTLELDGQPLETTELEAVAGDTIVGSYHDKHSDNTTTTPVAFSFTIEDAFPIAEPGRLCIRATSEEADPVSP